jgi:7-carboxy-7-deazaguanine synthase
VQGQSEAELDKHLAVLVDEVIERGWNLTTRMHILLWGDKRGV